MNVITLIGNLTRDPELRYIPGSGKPVATFTLAVQRPFKNKDGQQEADFINHQVWGKTAENCANYLKKGSKVGTTGRLQTRTYDKDGQRHYLTEVVADRVEFLGGGKDEGPQGQEKPNSDAPEGYQEIDSDDIPF